MRLLAAVFVIWCAGICPCAAEEPVLPNVAGSFYPDQAGELRGMVEGFLSRAEPEPMPGPVFALILPHAGYGYSGQTAAYGYKLIAGRPYRTVVVMAPSHRFGFNGISVYPRGRFRTPLGDLEVDEAFAAALLGKEREVVFEPAAFAQEHSLEVQLPFLQCSLSGFKIVPVVMGDCSLEACRKFSGLLKKAIGDREDVLVIASSDMYHGYDCEEAEAFDKRTLTYLENMDEEGLYAGLRQGSLQMCGGFPAVTAIALAKELGHTAARVLNYTHSGAVTGNRQKGTWTVGYASCAIDQPEEEGGALMLTDGQKKRLLQIARSSIAGYLKNGKKIEVVESDPVLAQKMGAFVTLHAQGQLRGCIGNLVGEQPLYLTVRDMAVEAAVSDPRFNPVGAGELKDIEIEISALSPLERVASADAIKVGTHGVLVRRGARGGVFLPQVAVETGWTKEEFLSNLCAHKAGLAADAWKDPATELYVFTAHVFSEKETKAQ